MAKATVDVSNLVDLSQANFARELALLGVTGVAHYAPYGTKLPESMEKLDKPWTALGWCNDSGISESQSEEKNEFSVWQSTENLREQINKREYTFKLTALSIGGLANALYYSVPEDMMAWDEETGVASFEQGGTIPEDYIFSLVIDIVDGHKARRIVIPKATVSERGDVNYTRSDLVGYEFTFKANLDAGAGYSVKRLFKEGWKPGTEGTMLAGAASENGLGDWSKDVATAEGDAKTYTFTLKGATAGTWDLAVGDKKATGLSWKATDEQVQKALRAKGEKTARVSGSVQGGFTISGVESKPTVTVTALEGVTSAEVSEATAAA